MNYFMGQKGYHSILCRMSQQLLCSCVGSKVVCHAVICQMLNVEPWDMLNNFCIRLEARVCTNSYISYIGEKTGYIH